MLTKNQIKDFMSAMNEAGISNPMDVPLEEMTIFADTQGVELDEVIEFCQIADEMNFSGYDFKVPTEPGVSEQEIGLLVEDYRAWLKEKNLRNNLKSLQDYLKEKSQNDEVTKELIVKIPRYWSENKLTELSDEEKPTTEPKTEETPAPKAEESKKPEEETQHSDTEETDKTPEGKKDEPTQMSDDEKKSAKEQLTTLKDKIAKADFADANSVKEFIECCGQVVELGKKFGKPEEFAKTVFDKPVEEPTAPAALKSDEGKKPEAPKTTPATTTETKTPEGKPANFSGEDKPSKGKFDYFNLYIKK